MTESSLEVGWSRSPATSYISRTCRQNNAELLKKGTWPNDESYPKRLIHSLPFWRAWRVAWRRFLKIKLNKLKTTPLPSGTDVDGICISPCFSLCRKVLSKVTNDKPNVYICFCPILKTNLKMELWDFFRFKFYASANLYSHNKWWRIIEKLTQQWNEEETNKEHPHLGSMNLNPEAIRRE